MATNLATSSEYEAQANRLRAQIGARVDALQSELTPSNLASEAASRIGMADLSWGGAFDYASKRHPVPTAIVGLGIALWTMAAFKNRGRREHLALVATPLRESSEFDSPVRDKGVSAASGGETSRVCRRRSIASRNGSDNAFRPNRQKTGERYRPPARRD